MTTYLHNDLSLKFYYIKRDMHSSAMLLMRLISQRHRRCYGFSTG